ncbi:MULTISPECIES: hypothetical protein [Xenorhabdus]|uniref:hypothetical protein n=1 Tax=Xenorhabdus TaxID=626 RepID=UPI00064A98B2|nr:MULTISPECIES: hypothetical protein [Xenorhabdus]KLU15226.1 hypothetical protein AAY47_12085 [Xenorhabdus griffiniae]KOP31724.1 hypothetical protein AFK69_19430 [Xenorhabdus sp. GDc328]
MNQLSAGSVADRFSQDNISLEDYRYSYFNNTDTYQPLAINLNLPASCYSLVSFLKEIAAQVTAALQHNENGALDDAGKKAIAAQLRLMAQQLTHPDDIQHLQLKAQALEQGYNQQMLLDLNKLQEGLSLVTGNISTWFGKTTKGRATAFAVTPCADMDVVLQNQRDRRNEVESYLPELHKRLHLSTVPHFQMVDLVFMCGEGNAHPKHIAYFLPEDEGYKYSPIKKTHYLSNTHLEMIQRISQPLIARYTSLSWQHQDLRTLAFLGVLGHEYGHFITLEETDFSQASKADRWLSVTLQEVAADVFGFLILAEVWGYQHGFSLQDCVSYHTSEMLRYINRGFHLFPDSDGMVMQLNYLLDQGSIAYQPQQQRIELIDAELFLCAFRSLARVLTDTLLSNDIAGMRFLERQYGVNSALTTRMSDFYRHLNQQRPVSLEYNQPAML